MGIRYQKRVNILGNFLRLNLSKSGVGFSMGVNGFRISRGPSGTILTLGIPGSGLSYRKHLAPPSGKWSDLLKKDEDKPTEKKQLKAQSVAEAEDLPVLQGEPGFFAPQHEKEFYKGLELYLSGEIDEALPHFMSASKKELGAAIFAALILAEDEAPINQSKAVHLLEKVTTADEEDDFPTELMQKYIPNHHINIGITSEVTASLAVDGLAVPLLLVEIYQANNRQQDAIALLEELDDLVDAPIVTLSICELYAEVEFWDGIIERGSKPDKAVDDIALETMLYYGRALQAKEMFEAAIKVYSTALRRKKGLDPDLLHVMRYWRATAYQSLGKNARARKDLEFLFVEAPQFKDEVEALLAEL